MIHAFLRCRAASPSLGLLLLAAWCLSAPLIAQERSRLPDGAISARSFIDTSEIISKYTTELYAHQCTMRMVKGMGYVVYQCNETTPEESKKGQLVRMAVFNMLAPAATARWVDIARPGESSNSIALADTFVGSPIVHAFNDDTLRIFFVGRKPEDANPFYRILYKDYAIATGTLSGITQVKCTVAKNSVALDLSVPAVQAHLDYLFGPGTGATYGSGISPTCDMVPCDGQLYSTVQIKSSAGGKTRLMTNILMRSPDQGATWELLGAPDPQKLPGEIKILAEPTLTHDDQNLYLHLRTNLQEHGYVLSRAKKADPYTFDIPVKRWTYGIGRPTMADFGKPIGMVAMFTAPSVPLSTQGVSRNRCDVVLIDRSYTRYTRAFSIVDYNAVNTPFMCVYNDEVYVAYTTGKRRLIPKFGTSEINFSKLRREFFVATPDEGDYKGPGAQDRDSPPDK